jgi:hypothetical protein
VPAEDDPVDTSQLLEQGDELLRSSRRLLKDLDVVIDSGEVEVVVIEDVDASQTGSSSDSR